MSIQYLGYWETDAPLTKEQSAEDRQYLEQLSKMLELPGVVAIRTLEVWVNGREYRWEKVRL